MNTQKALDRWVMMQDIPITTEEKLAFMIGYTQASADLLIIIKELKQELLRLKKMNALELADNLEEWISPRTVEQAVSMLRQQHAEIENLRKIAEEAIKQGFMRMIFIKHKKK